MFAHSRRGQNLPIPIGFLAAQNDRRTRPRTCQPSNGVQAQRVYVSAARISQAASGSTSTQVSGCSGRPKMRRGLVHQRATRSSRVRPAFMDGGEQQGQGGLQAGEAGRRVRRRPSRPGCAGRGRWRSSRSHPGSPTGRRGRRALPGAGAPRCARAPGGDVLLGEEQVVRGHLAGHRQTFLFGSADEQDLLAQGDVAQVERAVVEAAIKITAARVRPSA